ncbi:hypothetical protein [Gordonia cholesterolivorans]|uniref:hypothetical protein n=1 Tax=Gordonia cholesterolivorans TaxID=559625 RepID=UPI0031F7BFF9
MTAAMHADELARRWAAMAPEATSATQRSAASMNYREQCSVSPEADRRSRAGITREAQRAVAGPAVVNWYASQNPAINVDKTHMNIDRVNDGHGGFRPTRSIGEVVAYGDERVQRVKPGLKDGNRFAVTTVGQLPWAYCEPDGTSYHVVDKQGQKKYWPGGEPVMQPRYRVKKGMEAEVERYWTEWLRYQAELLPDGQRGMHGYSINLDETRPHIQLLSDPFEPAPSKKDPAAMKNGFSRAFGSHPKDDLVPMLTEAGEPVVDSEGKPRLVREGPSRKMERYQRQLRERMVERGFEVDLERDEARHNRHLQLPDYKELAHEKTAVQAQAADLGAALAGIEGQQALVQDLAATAQGEVAAADQEAAMIVAKAEETHARAAEEGYRSGQHRVDEAVAEVTKERDTAAAARAEAERHRNTAAADRGAATRLREEAEAEAERLREEAEADRDAAAADREQAAEALQGVVETHARIEELKKRYETTITEFMDRDVNAQSSYLILAMRQDKTTFGEQSALEHYKAEGNAMINRQRGLGRKVDARETEGQRRERSERTQAKVQAKTQEVNQKHKTSDTDQGCEQE